MKYKLSQRSLNKLAECHEDLQVLAKEAIKSSPYDYGISWGYRSPVMQNELYQQGRTKEGHIVTNVDGYNKKSKHNHLPALAFDVVAYVNGKVTWESSVYMELGVHIMEVAEELFEKDLIKNRITWGGHWHKFKDWPHFQI
jgi:peptidoglycan LD-endopeptidase CwlK